MPTTRRAFIQRAGLAAAAGLAGRVARAQPTDTIPGQIPGVPCKTSHEFKNWSKTIRFNPALFCEPKTEDQLVAIVKDAATNGTKVRVQGAGHSFNALCVTDDALVTLDRLPKTIWQSVSNPHHAIVPGGMRLKDLVPALKLRGLGMRNLGSITEQSIAGAFSTGTHGSGLKFGAIATQVLGIDLVDGNGDLRTINGQSPADELQAARINLGALGIITRVTLDCVPFYQLDYAAYVTTFDEILANIDQLVAENDRVVVWWLLMSKKKRDACVLITKNSVGHPVSTVLPNPDTPIKQCKPLSKDLTLLQAMLGRTPTSGFKLLQRCRDDYYKILTIPLLPAYHRECEYAIPAASTVTGLRRMRDIVEEGDVTLKLPVEIRWVAQDKALLSPAYNGDVAYVGASTMDNATEAFERFEPLMKSLGGRAHWGKNATITRDEVKALFPSTYQTFCDVRDNYDRKRVFANTMLKELFP